MGNLKENVSLLFFFARSGRRTPEKTKKSVNGRKDGDYELRNYRRRNPLDDDDELRAVVCDYVGPAECAGMLKLGTQPRSRLVALQSKSQLLPKLKPKIKPTINPPSAAWRSFRARLPAEEK